MLKRLMATFGALVFYGALLGAPTALQAAPPKNISQTVGVCDPLYPNRCIKPAADGSIAVTGGGGGGGSTSMTATAAAPAYVEGSTTNAISSDLHGSQRMLPMTPAGVAIDLSSVSTIAGADGTTVASSANPVPISDAGGTITVDGTVAATQSGTWNITNVSGTVSLPTGAATEASLVKLPLAQGSTTSGQSGPLDQCAVTTAAPTYTTAQTNPLSCDTTGALRVTGGGVAQGSTTSGQSGTLVQGAVLTGQPTYTTAQTSPVSITTKGNLRTAPCDDNGCVTTSNSNADGGGVFGRAMEVKNFPLLFNGTNYDRTRGITDSTGVPAGTGVAAVHQAPNSAAASAIVPVLSTAAEGSHVLKASAGNFYRLGATTGASAGYVMVFNATSAPADGAVTPQICRAVAANTSIEIDYTQVPSRFGTGITAVFSTGAGCFTKTISATATFEGYVE